jgi:ethanolamine utilization cobalamin adenosyltransferase
VVFRIYGVLDNVLVGNISVPPTILVCCAIAGTTTITNKIPNTEFIIFEIFTIVIFKSNITYGNKINEVLKNKYIIEKDTIEVHKILALPRYSRLYF